MREGSGSTLTPRPFDLLCRWCGCAALVLPSWSSQRLRSSLSPKERGADPSPQGNRLPEPCHPLLAPRAALGVSRPQPSGAASVLGLVHQCEVTLAEHLGRVGLVHSSCLLCSRFCRRSEERRVGKERRSRWSPYR